MLALTWFFRIISLLLGIPCIFVSLDLLYVWGVEDHPRRSRGYSLPPRPSRPGSTVSRPPGAHPPIKVFKPLVGQRGIRPSPDTWVWWEWPIRRPAFFLLLLGLALVAVGVLLWLPGYGNIPWVSDRIEGIAVAILGFTLLRGTFKISSPVIWKKVTLIKRPLSGKARPSLLWMGIGLVLVLVGLYGMACDFVDPAICLSGKSKAVWDLILNVAVFLSGVAATVGLEDIFQAMQGRERLQPKAVQLAGIGGVVLVAVLIGRVVFL